MRCTLPSKCLRTFGRAVHCLAKIGEELYLEGLPDGLTLKATNCARTAFASFLFREEFFLTYTDGSTKGRTGPETAKCKLAMRPFLNVFKSLANLERAVDHCSIHLDTEHCKLIIQFNYKQGLVRSHHLGYEDCESLQAIFSKEACPNLMSGPNDLFREVAAHFPQNLEEVSLSVAKDRLCFRTYFEDERVPAKHGATEISLAPAEFDEYVIQLDTSVVFSIKTMRALLVFAESGNHRLELRLEDSGKPVIASLEVFGGCEADMVLATLVDPDPNVAPTVSQVSTSVGVRAKVDLQESLQNECDNSSMLALQQTSRQDELVQSTLLQDEDGLMDCEYNISSPPPSLQLEDTAEMKGGRRQNGPGPGSSTSVAMGTDVEGNGRKGEALNDADFGFTRRSAQVPPSGQHSQLTNALFGDDSFLDNKEDELEMELRGQPDDEITESMVFPGTPQAKRYKASLIWDGEAGLDRDSQQSPPSPSTQVLAPDSDPEDQD